MTRSMSANTLRRKTWGTFGYGRIIGRAVADYAKAFADGSPVDMINPETREG